VNTTDNAVTVRIVAESEFVNTTDNAKGVVDAILRVPTRN